MTTSLSSSPVGVLRDRYFVCSLLTSLVHYIACRRITISFHKSIKPLAQLSTEGGALHRPVWQLCLRDDYIEFSTTRPTTTPHCA